MRAVEIYDVRMTVAFEEWMNALPPDVRRIMASRLIRASVGLLGDVEPVGEGVSEMRIHSGPGYRAYFKVVGRKMIFLLCGGTKKRQRKDIEQALEMARNLQL